MKHLFLGHFALIFSIPLLYGNTSYVYYDDLFKNQNFNSDINQIGNELTAKTGVNLYLAIYDDNNSGVEVIQSKIQKRLPPQSIVLFFAKKQKRVEIINTDSSLEHLYDRKQVLSPFPTFLSALYIALFYGSFEQKQEIMAHYGGTILPVLAQKTKGADTLKKYSVALFNGYADLSEQIAASKGVTLAHAVGNSNKITRNILRLIFYGILLFAILFYLYKKFFKHERKA